LQECQPNDALIATSCQPIWCTQRLWLQMDPQLHCWPNMSMRFCLFLMLNCCSCNSSPSIGVIFSQKQPSFCLQSCTSFHCDDLWCLGWPGSRGSFCASTCENFQNPAFLIGTIKMPCIYYYYYYTISERYWQAIRRIILLFLISW
jgi:hypothetical protein